METKNITKIIELMEKSDLSEFEIEQEGLKLRICRGYKGATPVISAPQTNMPAATAPAQSAEADDANAIYIKSPMVGTFYKSPSPESPAFVNVGDKVSSSSVVCILEAMKVMNEIHAELEGTITEILVENGQTIEYGQPLFKVSK